MKKLLVLLALTSSAAFAAGPSVNVNDQAFALLLKKNPVVKTVDNEKAGTAIDLLVPWLQSDVSYEQEGTLSVVSNSCEKVGAEYDCTLTIFNEDMTIDSNGDYVKPINSTESSILIRFKTDLSIQKITSDVVYFIAG